MVVTFLLAVALAQGSVASSDLKWSWDGRSPICVLRQTVPSTGETLGVRRTPGNGETVLQLESPRSRRLAEGRFPDATITLNSGTSVVGAVLTGRRPSGAGQIYVVTPDPRFFASFEKSSEVAFSHPKLGSITVPIRNAAIAAKALRGCEERRAREWGVNPAEMAAISRPIPIRDPREYFTSNDYPLDAASQGVRTDVIARLEVGSDGTVRKCGVVNKIPYESFGKTTCRVLKRAAFQPAMPGVIYYDVKFDLEGW